MARRALHQLGASIRIVFAVFSISPSGYQYQGKQANENEVIAHWLVRLT